MAQCTPRLYVFGIEANYPLQVFQASHSQSVTPAPFGEIPLILDPVGSRRRNLVVPVRRWRLNDRSHNPCSRYFDFDPIGRSDKILAGWSGLAIHPSTVDPATFLEHKHVSERPRGHMKDLHCK